MQRLVIHRGQIEGDHLTLTPEQRHYLGRVLRLQAGDRFWALDGQGQQWVATLLPPGDKALLEVSPQPAAAKATPLLTTILVASLPKQGFDEVVRQATELGVACIVPVLSDRTVLRPSGSKVERWRRIAAEAAEQSERLMVPTVEDPVPWQTWVDQAQYPQRLLCTARFKASPLWEWALQHPGVATVEVAVGPEGGWTGAEVSGAIAAGYQPVRLGAGILRAVTAPIAALSILQAAFEFATMKPQSDKAP